MEGGVDGYKSLNHLLLPKSFTDIVTCESCRHIVRKIKSS